MNTEADWTNFLLAKVQYGEESEGIKKFKAYFHWFNGFQEKYQKAIENHPNAIIALMALHKNLIWSHENEVRLLTYRSFDKCNLEEANPSFFPLKHGITRSGSQYSYVELPIYRSTVYRDLEARFDRLGESEYLLKSQPVIKLSNIIVGYRNSKSLVNEVYNLADYFSGLYKQNIAIKHSSLLKFMQ